MVEKRNFPLVAGLALVVALTLPAMASHAREADHDHHEEWSKTLARDVKAQVKAGLAGAAVGMEKGAEEMLRGADEMEAYANRLERDAAFREREAARENDRRDDKVTVEQLLAAAPKMRRSAEKMRAGADKLRVGAEKMRRGDDS